METMTWKVGGGFEADGIVVYPPDFTPDKKYPLVLLIHGGPQSASVERFDAWGQMIAARDTSSSSRTTGAATTWARPTCTPSVGDWGKGPGEDVMAGLDGAEESAASSTKRGSP